MAGHSHWAGIKHKKGRADKEKSKIFSKLSREITVAAKLGNKDPEMNSRLRTAIQAAKIANMPKDNIQRAIKKSEVTMSSNFESIRYEGFGPEKIAVVVETLTNNKNRTASNIRTIFQKNGGNLGTSGVTTHLFKQVGIIRLDKSNYTNEEVINFALDSGAEDNVSTKFYENVMTKVEDFYKVKTNLEKKGVKFLEAKIEWYPLNKIKLDKEKSKNLVNFLQALEDDEDVQNVFTNGEFEIGY